MRNRKGNWYNQVVVAGIDGVGDWCWISTKIRGSAIGRSEGIQLGCDSIDHEENGIVDPRVYLVEIGSEGDGIMRDEIGPSARDLVRIAGISYKDVVTLIRVDCTADYAMSRTGGELHQRKGCTCGVPIRQDIVICKLLCVKFLGDRVSRARDSTDQQQYKEIPYYHYNNKLQKQPTKVLYIAYI